jgi:hypothetical protein
MPIYPAPAAFGRLPPDGKGRPRPRKTAYDALAAAGIGFDLRAGHAPASELAGLMVSIVIGVSPPKNACMASKNAYELHPCAAGYSGWFGVGRKGAHVMSGLGRPVAVGVREPDRVTRSPDRASSSGSARTSPRVVD